MGGRGRSKPGAGRGTAPTPAESARRKAQPPEQPHVTTQSAWGMSTAAQVTSAWGPPASAPVQSAWGRPAPAVNPVVGQSSSSAAEVRGMPQQGTQQQQRPQQGTQQQWPQQGTQQQQRPQQGTQQQQRPQQGTQQQWPQQGTQQQWPQQGTQQQQRPQQGTQQQRPQQDTQQQQESQPRGYVGYGGNGDRAGLRGRNGVDGDPNEGNGRMVTSKRDRGSCRGGFDITEKILRTKPESVQSKKGKSGQVVPLTTNYFRLTKKPDWQLYQYRVDINPPIENDLFKKKLIAEQKAHLGGYLFDGTILILSIKLSNEVTEFMTKDRDDNPIQIKVKFVGLVSMETAASFQILNLILRRSMAALDLTLVGRNYFDATKNIDIRSHSLQLWPGYVTSIRQHEADILLCAEVTTKVVRTDTLYDIMCFCRKRNDSNWTTSFSEAVIGMTVLTDYNNKTYRIHDVDYDMSPMDTFATKKGTTSTFVDYYQSKYKINIRNRTQPLLVSKLKERDLRAGQPEFILLIPEVCRATGMTESMRNDRRLMEALAVYTRVAPKERMAKARAFNQRLQTTPASMNFLQEWNFGLDPNLVQVNGRQLANETILFGKNQSAVSDEKGDWSQQFRNFSMFMAIPLRNWALIVPQTRVDDADRFVGIMQKAWSGTRNEMRYEIAKPNIIGLIDDRSHSYMKALEQAMHKNPQLIMCILNNNRDDKYAMIKKKCCISIGVPSQVALINTITPKPGRDWNSLLSVGTKVGIQINSKLGGTPWMVDIPISGVMVVGFDVCHDTTDKNKDKNKRRSFGALVATMDMKEKQNYFSAVSPHVTGQELSDAFALDLMKALQCYRKQHGRLPARIIIYRDGVGEGQTNYVYEHELKNIIEKLTEMYEGCTSPKIHFIVVSKRINTRFFKGDFNPSPGTVVDDIVTLPERYDFFLISQHCRQGTVSPTNYNVLHNGDGVTGWSPELLQRFTYKMTHLYYNWSGTLGVPAVCQYAHKLAFMAGTYLHNSPSHLLEKQLYFL